MKIRIVGGGPSGLYFAALMKRQDPSHEIEVFERNPPDATFGWGVVFSRRTVDILREHDPTSLDHLLEKARQWEDVVVVHQDQTMPIGGNQFVGVERLAMLRVLQARCEQLGVTLHFQHEVEDFDALRDCDLLVGADGVRSVVRDKFASHFQPTLEEGRNRYTWLGTPQLFHGLTLTFRPHEAGLFMAHSYKYSEARSTFIVECTQETFEASGLPEEIDETSLQFLGEVFAADLGGHPLLTNNSRWIRFLLVKNQQWQFDNVVLLGDACHTAHFSIGSGTKLALEDSIALARTFGEIPEVSNALPEYQNRRKPQVDEFQQAAHSSLVWFETAHEKLHLSPMEFAMDCMTRSNRLGIESIRKRDPKFVEAYESGL